MAIDTDKSVQIAEEWCQSRDNGWTLGDQLGAGGTAPVFEINSPDGQRALKIYDRDFSVGERGGIELKRIEQQIALGGHKCPSLVQIYDGGVFRDRLFLLMSRAPGKELEKCLQFVPRQSIRKIVSQVAEACLFLKSANLCHRDIKAANIFISDDFCQATLLDVSVIRNIHDPVGVGTDHDGQLPVLATARYSPPEYLFRLLEPGPELWHALNIYQLGALLHDLIMREPLFQSEYLRSAENRYRFAWIVATATPKVTADDVDQDLVFLAQRAMDKDWQRRSVLALEEFLADPKVQQEHAFQFLGLVSDPRVFPPSDDTGATLQHLRDVASGLEQSILQFLRKYGVTAIHEVKAGTTDTSKIISFRWDTPADVEESGYRSSKLELVLRLLVRPSRHCFGISVKLVTSAGGASREVVLELPDVDDDANVETVLRSYADSAFSKLAVEITRSGAEAQEG